jgi:hypothetical protein
MWSNPAALRAQYGLEVPKILLERGGLRWHRTENTRFVANRRIRDPYVWWCEKREDGCSAHKSFAPSYSIPVLADFLIGPFPTLLFDFQKAWRAFWGIIKILA